MKYLEFYAAAMPKATARVIAQKLGEKKTLVVLAAKWAKSREIAGAFAESAERTKAVTVAVEGNDDQALFAISPFKAIRKMIADEGFVSVGGHANVNFSDSFSSYFEKNGKVLRFSDHCAVCSKSMHCAAEIVLACNPTYDEVVAKLKGF